MTIVRIAMLTLHEMVRRRLIVTAVVLTVLIAALTGWGFHALAHAHRHGHDVTHAQVLVVSATMLILIAYVFSLIYALGGAFIAAPSLAADIESGLLLPVLTRSVRRSEIVLGKFFGLAALLCAYAFFSGLLEFGIVNVVTGYWPPHPIIALTYLCGVAVVMLSVTLLFSARLPAIPSGVAAVVLFGVAWICGIVGDIGANLHFNAFANAGTVSQLVLPSDAFWRAAVYDLEPAALVATIHTSAPFVVTAPPPLAMMLWSVGWIVVVVAAACWSFATRDV
jgi:ABC-type transport system involved in multi-copper enzyme maturation permease subunit